MVKIAVVNGSTRPRRQSTSVVEWVMSASDRHEAVKSGDVTVEVLDLADFGLPLLDEATPPMFGEYAHEHTRRWAAAVGEYDAYVFVTPEYNHSVPAALKNAIDYLYAEWNHKVAGFVSYGVLTGSRAVEHLRLALLELKVANVRSQVGLSAFTDFEVIDPEDMAAPGRCVPGEHQEPTLFEMLDEMIEWSRALKPLRATEEASA